MPERYTDWKAAFADAVRAQGGTPVDAPAVLVSMTFVRALPLSKRTGRPTPATLAKAMEAPPTWADADNLAGGVLDALQDVLWANDRTVDLGAVRRVWGARDMIVIEVRALQPADWLPEEWL